MIDYALLGKRIAKYRKKRAYTQAILAEKADISNNYLSNIEHNRSIPSLETLMSLCNALELTPNDLLIGTDSKDKQYLSTEMAELFSSCSPSQKSLIIKFIQLLLDESYD